MNKIQLKNTAIMLIVAIALVFGISAVTKPEPVSYNPGTYYGTATGMHEGLWVKVDVSEDAIKSVEVIENYETVGICEPAIEEVPQKIVEFQTSQVSAVSGATFTSNGIKDATASALEQAKGNAEIITYTPPAPKADPVPLGYTYKAGEYTAKAEGFEDFVTVTVIFSDTKIESVEITKCGDTPERVEMAKASVPADIVKWQTYEVDAAAGATFTSQGIMDAVKNCVNQAKN